MNTETKEYDELVNMLVCCATPGYIKDVARCLEILRDEINYLTEMVKDVRREPR